MAWKDKIEDWTKMKFTESQIAAQIEQRPMERNINQKCQKCLHDLKELRDEKKIKKKKKKIM